MGQLAAVMPILSAVGTVLSFAGSMQEANAQQKYANYQAEVQQQTSKAQQQIYEAQAVGLEREAQQATQIAGQERAAAQRNAIEERRRSRLLQSRARAVAGASGGGVSDPTVVNLMGDVGAEGEYSALAALFEGDLAGQGYENMAGARKYEAALQRTGGNIARQTGNSEAALTRGAGAINAAATRRTAFGSLLSSPTSQTLLEKYGTPKGYK